MVSYIGNNPTYFLYLFDPSKNVFKKLEGFDNFPDAIQLKSYPLFYYSYHRAGCADLNWISDLFKIEKFKAIHIGQIYGQGCAADLKLYPQKIDIIKFIITMRMRGLYFKPFPTRKLLEHITTSGSSSMLIGRKTFQNLNSKGSGPRCF